MNNEVLLGDVVISDIVIQYDPSRPFPNEFRENDTLEGYLGRPDKESSEFSRMFKQN